MSLLQDAIIRQAQRQPGSLALACGTDRLTYGELDLLSNQLARLLREIGCEPGDRVAIVIPKSVTAIVAILGCLKAGCIYVPVDGASPPARLLSIQHSCEFRCILAAGPAHSIAAAALADAGGDAAHLGWLSDPVPPDLRARFTGADLACMPSSPIQPRRQPDAPAHILFTSGSTGTPKGVAITHANVLAFVEWGIEHFGYTPSDRMSGHSPLHFDLSTFDIFGTLSAGASLHLITPEMSLLPHRLASIIRGLELTQWFSVPSLLNYLAKFDVVQSGDFPLMRRLLWCGEVFPTPALIYWMQRLPHVKFTNLYGPTETTIASGYYDVPRCPEDDTSRIPIGRPCAGEEFLVMDAELRSVAVGEIGELFIGGVGLSPGYWRDPEKTARAFIPNPFSADPGARIYRTGDLASTGEDGMVYLHGRTDSQIKSRGYRIELGEVEAAVHATGDVRECAAVALQTGGFEGAAICCVYVPAAGRRPSPHSLRSKIAQALPPYMIPAYWMSAPALPLNSNGKIDRSAVRRSFETARGSAARAS